MCNVVVSSWSSKTPRSRTTVAASIMLAPTVIEWSTSVSLTRWECVTRELSMANPIARSTLYVSDRKKMGKMSNLPIYPFNRFLDIISNTGNFLAVTISIVIS